MSLLSVCFKAIDGAWDQEVENYPIDVYHLSGWLSASSIIDKGQPQGIMVSYNHKKMFYPIIMREIASATEAGVAGWDATSTYGYGGPIVDESLSQADINIMMQAAVDFLCEQGCVSWFIRLHPILNKDWNVDVGQTIQHGPTLVSDLTKSADEHWQETQNRHRRGIRKALKAEVITKIETLSPDNVQVFSGIYNETMTSVAANDYYFFDECYFQQLCRQLPQRLLLITANKDDSAIASSIYTTCEQTGIMQFHLGGTLEVGRQWQPSKLITHVARGWGREAGYQFLHLGGGVGTNQDSLYEYKKGFSSNELVFKTHRIITNPKKYQALIKAAKHIDSEAASDFFPLYRKPA